MINPMDLTGKHVLITGGSSGIGFATAKLCAELGARVSLVARREENLKNALGLLVGPGRHMYFQYDLERTVGIEQLVKDIIAKAGPLDGMVHSAGGGRNLPISMTKPDFAERIMRLNLFAFLELVRVITKKKMMNDGASIIAISSVASLCGDCSQGAYAAAKAAQNGVIHTMAKELAGRGIRANTVAFGMVKTDAFEEWKNTVGGEESLNSQYLGVLNVQDAANAVCFLLGPAARFITGTTLVADGGYLS